MSGVANPIHLDGEGVGRADGEVARVDVGVVAVGRVGELARRARDRLLELVDHELVASEVAVAVPGAADHVRRDRCRQHLEDEDDQQRGDGPDRVLVEGDGRQHEDQAEDLRLRRGVHPGQGVGEAEEPDPGGQREQGAGDQQDGGGDVVGRVGDHDGSCFET
nr:hypothetical protein GCM10025699_47180 [Microbacterium flavescens]